MYEYDIKPKISKGRSYLPFDILMKKNPHDGFIFSQKDCILQGKF